MGGLFHKLRHPRRCYVVCTIPRSGSNLLTDGLRATRQAGMPKQFFLPKSEDRYGAELGVEQVYCFNVGPNQREFIERFGAEVLPQLAS